MQGTVLSAALSETPVKSYKKTTLGKVLLKVWDSMLNAEKELVFRGDPRRGDEAVYDVFSDHERIYFERMNRRLFQTGDLIEYTRPEALQEVKKPVEQYSDDELKEIINARGFALGAALNKIDSVAVLFRIQSLATEMDKSEKILATINARISEVQSQEFNPKHSEESTIEE